MNEKITFQSMRPFGKLEGDVLRISEGFDLSMVGEESCECLKVSVLSKFYGENAPHITFSLTAKGQEEPFYISHDYIIGKKDEYTLQSWRIPPFFLPEITFTLKLDIPEGTSLLIRSFSSEKTTPTREWWGGLRHNAHLGFWGLAPDNTMPAFELAAACGFPACIVVPKVTKDGVLVCIHDDTVNRTARDENGNAFEEPLAVKDLTYEELLKFDYGLYKNEIYRGTKIPTLEEFFALCARTGMRPMFSTHPALTEDQWREVKKLLIRYNLLPLFNIKSFRIETLKLAYSVFGNEIEGYTWDNHDWSEGKIEEMKNSGINPKKCRVGIELKFKKYTKEIAEEIIANGYFASAWAIGRKTADEYKRLISYGVSEFTEDFHCSMGLNW